MARTPNSRQPYVLTTSRSSMPLCMRVCPGQQINITQTIIQINTAYTSWSWFLFSPDVSPRSGATQLAHHFFPGSLAASSDRRASPFFRAQRGLQSRGEGEPRAAHSRGWARSGPPEVIYYGQLRYPDCSTTIVLWPDLQSGCSVSDDAASRRKPLFSLIA